MIRSLHRTLSPADIASLANSACGLLAILACIGSPTLAARLILLAAIADGLDGILARTFGGSDLGEYLDGLSDAVSFGIAPAVILVLATTQGNPMAPVTGETALVVGAAVVYLVLALVRLGLYTAEDAHAQYTTGVPTTLAATFLALAILGGITEPLQLAGLTCVLAILMVTDTRYPDLRARDALVMGSLQASVVIAPTLLNSWLLWLLAGCAAAYLVLGPHAYKNSAKTSPS